MLISVFKSMGFTLRFDKEIFEKPYKSKSFRQLGLTLDLFPFPIVAFALIRRFLCVNLKVLMKKFNYRKRINSCLHSAGQFEVKLDNEFDFDEKQNYNKSLNSVLQRTVKQGTQNGRLSGNNRLKLYLQANVLNSTQPTYNLIEK